MGLRLGGAAGPVEAAGDGEGGVVEVETVDELVALYRAVFGEHTDWDEYRRDMVADGRLVVRLHFDHAYGMVPTG